MKGYLPRLSDLESGGITLELARELRKWGRNNNDPALGKLGARLVGFIATPATAALDAVAHSLFFVGKLYLGLILAPYHFAAAKINVKTAVNHDLEIGSALVHLARAIDSLFRIAYLPLLILCNPDKGFAFADYNPMINVFVKCDDKKLKAKQAEVDKLELRLSKTKGSLVKEKAAAESLALENELLEAKCQLASDQLNEKQEALDNALQELGIKGAKCSALLLKNDEQSIHIVLLQATMENIEKQKQNLEGKLLESYKEIERLSGKVIEVQNDGEQQIKLLGKMIEENSVALLVTGGEVKALKTELIEKQALFSKQLQDKEEALQEKLKESQLLVQGKETLQEQLGKAESEVELLKNELKKKKHRLHQLQSTPLNDLIVEHTALRKIYRETLVEIQEKTDLVRKEIEVASEHNKQLIGENFALKEQLELLQLKSETKPEDAVDDPGI